ncbi:MAG TPA: PilZ domain-containing protein [Rhizomicrobium sp.]|nr:PilZ domain-containing protein [Rhizomicrobium sp.]
MDSTPASSPENRKFERIQLFLPGQLFNPLNEQSSPCKVLNLSAGGAAVQCEATFPAGLSLVLYIENFGRFEGRTIVHGDGQLALEFSIGEAKRGRLKEMLQSFTASGVAGVTEVRKHARVPSLVSGSITRENGEQIMCDVLDISLDGVSLRTKVRPPVGEIVNLGRARGRVVRHHQDGIAIQYVKEVGRAA